jgi:hypothetical protein
MLLSREYKVTILSFQPPFYLILIRTGSFLRKAVLLLRHKGMVRLAAWTDMHLKGGLMHARGISRYFMRKEISHSLLQKLIKAGACHEEAVADPWVVTVMLSEIISVHRS